MIDQSFARARTGVAAIASGDFMGRVMGYVGFSFVFTAGGAVLGNINGPGLLFPALIVGFVALIALMFLKERSPLNLALLYTFATAEGVFLGQLLQSYIASGLGSIVVLAAAATGAITCAAAVYGVTTHRDLSGLGGMLFVALIGVVVVSIVGLFIHMTALHVVISGVTALLFTGFLVYDFNRMSRARSWSEGDAVLMAVSIYLDILNLFLSLLQILSALTGNSRR
jgi:FtsH-binding integral membrane protein